MRLSTIFVARRRLRDNSKKRVRGAASQAGGALMRGRCGAVGNHLRVLLDAGVVACRRSGRHVRYWRTALGEALIAADGTEPAQ